MARKTHLVFDRRLKQKLQRKLDLMSIEISSVVAPKSLFESANSLANHMRAVVPVDTGALRNSIGVAVDGAAGSVSDYVSWKNTRGRLWYSTKVSIAMAIGIVGA